MVGGSGRRREEHQIKSVPVYQERGYQNGQNACAGEQQEQFGVFVVEPVLRDVQMQRVFYARQAVPEIDGDEVEQGDRAARY